MEPILRHSSDFATVWEGDARQVAAMQETDSKTLAILDGPYGMSKADWDRMKVADLPEWYRPHLEDVDRILAPSASLYVWNAAAGLKVLHPLIVSMGWTWRVDITWDKGASPAQIGHRQLSCWIDSTEVCGFYTRGDPYFMCPADGLSVWRGSTRGHRLLSGETFVRKAGCSPERIPLHPCQKPVAFAERMIRASMRPTESGWAPFGGTLREAIASERIAWQNPAEARHVVTAELNQDKRKDGTPIDYIGPALATLREQRLAVAQRSLFAAVG